MLEEANVEYKKAIAKLIAKALIIWLDGRSGRESEVIVDLFSFSDVYSKLYISSSIEIIRNKF